jgi:hypothetical protein
VKANPAVDSQVENVVKELDRAVNDGDGCGTRRGAHAPRAPVPLSGWSSMREPFVAEIRLFCLGLVPAGWTTCGGRLLGIATRGIVPIRLMPR